MSGVDSDAQINYVRYNRETISSLRKLVIRTYRTAMINDIFIPVLNKNKISFNYFTGIHQDNRKESVIRIVVDSGKELNLTEDMEVYTRTVGWKLVRDLKVGEAIAVQGDLICIRCGNNKCLSGFTWLAHYHNVCKDCLYTVFRDNPDGDSIYQRCLNFNLVPPTGVIMCAQFGLLFEPVIIREAMSKSIRVLYATAKNPHNSFTANSILVRRT